MDTLKRLKQDEIEFVRFETLGVVGTSIGKLVPIKQCRSVIENGIGIAACGFVCTIDDKLDHNDWDPDGFRNALCKIYPDTYTIIPWSNYKMASIMIYPTINNKLLPINPRSIALQQLTTLKKIYGIDFLSSIEHEFTLLDLQTGQNFKDHTRSALDMSLTMQNENYWISMCDNFKKMGIKIEAITPETKLGQFEITAKPSFNIKGGDDAYRIKLGVKEMAYKHNMRATFVTVPNDKGKSAAHFNMSLWVNDKSKNVLYDSSKSNQCDGLSDIARYWIGGILKHISGLMAIVCPTNNCFERIANNQTDHQHANWGRFNRAATIRVKCNGEKTYLEFRTPSALSNPYLVMAGVVIAGMDGIENKIKPPQEFTNDMQGNDALLDQLYDTTPKTLKDALDALEKDEVLCNGFDGFVKYYINVKKVEMKADENRKKRPCLFSML